MKRNYVYVAVISCVILLAGSLAGCQNTVQQEPKVEQVQESTRIDSGMLVTYDGENTELTVSDTVTKVDADLFKETKSPEEVTHIVLGAGVEEISPTAFDGFTELRSVTVPKENKNSVLLRMMRGTAHTCVESTSRSFSVSLERNPASS